MRQSYAYLSVNSPEIIRARVSVNVRVRVRNNVSMAYSIRVSGVVSRPVCT